LIVKAKRDTDDGLVQEPQMGLNIFILGRMNSFLIIIIIKLILLKIRMRIVKFQIIRMVARHRQ
jgi:hypothetical protein